MISSASSWSMLSMNLGLKVLLSSLLYFRDFVMWWPWSAFRREKSKTWSFVPYGKSVKIRLTCSSCKSSCIFTWSLASAHMILCWPKFSIISASLLPYGVLFPFVPARLHFLPRARFSFAVPTIAVAHTARYSSSLADRTGISHYTLAGLPVYYACLSQKDLLKALSLFWVIIVLHEFG